MATPLKTPQINLQPAPSTATIRSDKLETNALVYAGAFTEVHIGTYRGNPCAIQKIREFQLANASKNQIAAFMDKVSKMETMTSRNIIR